MKLVAYLFALLIASGCAPNQTNPIANAENGNTPQEQILKQTLARYPDSALALQNLVGYYANMQNYTAALATVNAALQKDSANANLWDLQSIVALQKGDTTLATQALENAITLLPLPEYLISLGELYAQIGNAQAIIIADALLSSPKANSAKEAYFIKGIYYSYSNDKPKAITYFDKAMQVDYNFIQAYVEKALALYDLAKYQLAANTLETAIKVKNSYDLSYYYLGKCYEKLNRPQEALEMYNTVLQLNPDDEDAKDALSRLGVK